MLVELDPIGPDGQPTVTTVMCPACETVYRVPFEHRNSTFCGCPIRRAAMRSISSLFEVDPAFLTSVSGQLCEPVRVGLHGRPISRLELEQAKRDKAMQSLQRPVYSGANGAESLRALWPDDDDPRLRESR